MILKITNYILIVLVCIICTTACSKNDSSVNAARLRIKLTDAPSLTAKELTLSVQGVEVSVTDSSDVPGEWIPLEFSGGTYNLLTLSNGKTQQIVDQYFPANGTIRKVKLLLGTENTLVTSEGDKNLIIPSEYQDGIIVDVTANLYANIICSIVIDINAAVSITESNGNYYLNPVVRAFPEEFGGSVRGYISPTNVSAYVEIADDADTLFSIPESDGMFMFTGLKEGEWDISIIVDPSSGYRDTIFTDSVYSREITEITPNPIVLKTIESDTDDDNDDGS